MAYDPKFCKIAMSSSRDETSESLDDALYDLPTYSGADRARLDGVLFGGGHLRNDLPGVGPESKEGEPQGSRNGPQTLMFLDQRHEVSPSPIPRRIQLNGEFEQLKTEPINKVEQDDRGVLSNQAPVEPLRSGAAGAGQMDESQIMRRLWDEPAAGARSRRATPRRRSRTTFLKLLWIALGVGALALASAALVALSPLFDTINASTPLAAPDFAPVAAVRSVDSQLAQRPADYDWKAAVEAERGHLEAERDKIAAEIVAREKQEIDALTRNPTRDAALQPALPAPQSIASASATQPLEAGPTGPASLPEAANSDIKVRAAAPDLSSPDSGSPPSGPEAATPTPPATESPIVSTPTRSNTAEASSTQAPTTPAVAAVSPSYASPFVSAPPANLTPAGPSLPMIADRIGGERTSHTPEIGSPIEDKPTLASVDKTSDKDFRERRALLPDGMPTRVLIRYDGSSDRARRRAETIATSLAEHGYDIADVRKIASPVRSELRFSYAADEAVALDIAQLAGVEPVRAPTPKVGLMPRPGLIEVSVSTR